MGAHKERSEEVGNYPLFAAIALAAVIMGCASWANLSYAVKNPANYRYFPPFRPNVNRNLNDRLGGEYYNMARSLAAGQGFSHPFDRPTGPTAWQPPVLPLILAGLLWVSGGNRDFVTTVVVVWQVLVLIGTGWMSLALVRQTTRRIGAGVAASIFLLGLVSHFRRAFQHTSDGWLVLLTIDLLIAGFCWGRPLQRVTNAAGWGLFGGLAAMINPGVALAWGIMSLLLGMGRRRVSTRRGGTRRRTHARAVDHSQLSRIRSIHSDQVEPLL